MSRRKLASLFFVAAAAVGSTVVAEQPASAADATHRDARQCVRPIIDNITAVGHWEGKPSEKAIQVAKAAGEKAVADKDGHNRQIRFDKSYFDLAWAFHLAQVWHDYAQSQVTESGMRWGTDGDDAYTEDGSVGSIDDIFRGDFLGVFDDDTVNYNDQFTFRARFADTDADMTVTAFGKVHLGCE